jgi:hypothetical protein
VLLRLIIGTATRVRALRHPDVLDGQHSIDVLALITSIVALFD